MVVEAPVEDLSLKLVAALPPTLGVLVCIFLIFREVRLSIQTIVTMVLATLREWFTADDSDGSFALPIRIQVVHTHRREQRADDEQLDRRRRKRPRAQTGQGTRLRSVDEEEPEDYGENSSSDDDRLTDGRRR